MKEGELTESKKEAVLKKSFLDLVKSIVTITPTKTTLELLTEESKEMLNKNTYVLLFRWNVFKDRYENQHQLDNENTALTKEIYLIDRVKNFFKEIENVKYFKLGEAKLACDCTIWCTFVFQLLAWGGIIAGAIILLGTYGGIAAGVTSSTLLTVIVLIISDCNDVRAYSNKIMKRSKGLQKKADEYNEKYLSDTDYQLQISKYGGIVKIVKNAIKRKIVVSERDCLTVKHSKDALLNNNDNNFVRNNDYQEKSTNRTRNIKPIPKQIPTTDKKSSTNKVPKDRSTQKITIKSSSNQESAKDLGPNLDNQKVSKKRVTKEPTGKTSSPDEHFDSHNDSGMAMLEIKDMSDPHIRYDFENRNNNFVIENVKDVNFTDDFDDQKQSYMLKSNYIEPKNSEPLTKSNEFETREQIKEVHIVEKSHLYSNEKIDQSSQHSNPNTLRLDSRYSSKIRTNNNL